MSYFIIFYYINEAMLTQSLHSNIHILSSNTKTIKKLGGEFVKCKNCHHYSKSTNVEISNELIDVTGICNLSGAVRKSKDKCANGNFLRK
jgi:cytochrome c2